MALQLQKKKKKKKLTPVLGYLCHCRIYIDIEAVDVAAETDGLGD
jgi:hypothetical protein